MGSPGLICLAFWLLTEPCKNVTCVIIVHNNNRMIKLSMGKYAGNTYIRLDADLYSTFQVRNAAHPKLPIII